MAGESLLKSIGCPRSVFTASYDMTSQPNRHAVATKAPAGPCTFAHGDGRSASTPTAVSTSRSRAGLGSQPSQTASAHFTMGASWAAKAGSTLPLIEPSARTSARSSSPLPPGTEAAATDVRWARSMVEETPVLPCP
eukprot:1757445-Heterocapsa_arctica.AAC.1